jgi:hypothetical protein
MRGERFFVTNRVGTLSWKRGHHISFPLWNVDDGGMCCDFELQLILQVTLAGSAHETGWFDALKPKW